MENGDHHPSEEDQSEDDLSTSIVNGNRGEDEEESMDQEEDSSRKNGTSIHIDGLKKKLIADQIRQRVQNKPIQSIRPSIMQPMKRGRGRPPKQTQEDSEEEVCLIRLFFIMNWRSLELLIMIQKGYNQW